MPRKPEKSQCALCERWVSQVSRHHLIPKSLGGREVVPLCATCHKTLHSFFYNVTLSKELHSLEALRAQEDVARYLAWVRKQPDRAIRVRTRRQRR
ncbi:MAG: HNH endonuclease [Anaerolineae bacterium]|nr:HNH endonuclease [Anaerolineae bacterium]MDW8173414.1 HNH endonuclease [Anaerolineae bacterium]